MFIISSKYEQVLDCIKSIKPGTKISVRGLAESLHLSAGTVYKAIKEAEAAGLVITKPKAGTVRIDSESRIPGLGLSGIELMRVLGLHAEAGRPNLRNSIEKIIVCDSDVSSLQRRMENYNSSSVFAFFRHVQDPALASKAGIIGAFVYMLAILLVCFFGRKRLNDRAILGAAVLFAVGIPFLLPHMHDRYFYCADILTLVLAFASWRCALAAPLTQFASLLGYHAYLKMRFLLMMRYGAMALLAVLVIAVGYFSFSLFDDSDAKTASPQRKKKTA